MVFFLITFLSRFPENQETYHKACPTHGPFGVFTQLKSGVGCPNPWSLKLEISDNNAAYTMGPWQLPSDSSFWLRRYLQERVHWWRSTCARPIPMARREFRWSRRMDDGSGGFRASLPRSERGTAKTRGRVSCEQELRKGDHLTFVEYLIICVETLSLSSLRPLCLMTDTGIGFTIVACSRNQVCILFYFVFSPCRFQNTVKSCTAPRNLPFLISPRGTMMLAMYSSMWDPSLHPNIIFSSESSSESQMYLLLTAARLWAYADSPPVASISRMPFPTW